MDLAMLQVPGTLFENHVSKWCTPEVVTTCFLLSFLTVRTV